MKNQWLVLVFIFGVIVVVVFAFNSKDQTTSSSFDEVPSDFEYGSDEIMEPEGVQPPEVIENVTESVSQAEEQVVPPVIAKEQEHPAIEPVESAVEAVVERVEESVPAGITDFSKVPYTIQIVSVKELEAARRALADVIKHKYQGFIAQRNLGDKGIWYRVYVGQFDSKQQADEALADVRKDFPSAFVISPSKKSQASIN